MAEHLTSAVIEPFLFSNSSAKDWHTCARKLYNRQIRLGTGVVTPFVSEDLEYGTIIHDQLPKLWNGDVSGIGAARVALQTRFLADPNWWKDISPDYRNRKAAEWGRLLEGHLYGIQRVVLPRLQRQYTLVSAEGDGIKWLGESAALLAKPDTLVYAKEDAWDAIPGIGYMEWKTIAAVTPQSTRQWKRNPQAWTGAIVTREGLGIDLEWFQVTMLVKGKETRDENGMEWRSGPLCYGWRFDPSTVVKDTGAKPLDGVMVASDGSRWVAEGTTRKGWHRTSTDEFPGGIAAWVKAMPVEVLSSCFAETEPEVIDWELAAEWLHNQENGMVSAVLAYKREVAAGNAEAIARDKYFPRELSQCEADQYGRRCTYHDLDHRPEVNAEPLTMYVRRQPHHPLEIKVLGGAK